MKSSLANTIAFSLLVLYAGCTDIDTLAEDPTAPLVEGSGDKEPNLDDKASGAISVYVAPVFGPADLTTNDLQVALDFVSQPSIVGDTVWIELQPGLYRNDNSCLTVSQKDWRTNCSPIASRTAFLLAGRRAPTYIYGASGNPQDVVIWGKVPSDVLGNGNHAFHGLTLDDNSAMVEISDLSIASDGGWIGNGIGDASLAVVNSRSDLRNTIVLANKSNSNCLWGDASGDQEGILADGAGTYLRIYDSAVGGNLHTDITNNHVGLRIDGGSWGGAPSITRFTNAHVYNTHNRLASNAGGDVTIDNSQIIGSGWYHAWGNSATAPGGDGPLDGSLWSKLLAVKSFLATVPRVCTTTGPICS